MGDFIEYGVFQVGQIWRVTDGNRAELGFPNLEAALAAANLLVAVHRACGIAARAVMLDEIGRLAPAPGST